MSQEENLQDEINQIIGQEQTEQQVVEINNIQASNPTLIIDQDTFNQKNDNKVLSKLLIIGIAFGIIVLIILLQKIITNNSYSSCIKNENSRVMELEPAYCVNPNGKIIWKNKEDALPIDDSGSKESYDDTNPPETILPEFL